MHKRAKTIFENHGGSKALVGFAPYQFGWLTNPGSTFDESKPKSVPNLMMGQRFSFSSGSEAKNVAGNLKKTSKQRRLHREVSQWTFWPGLVSYPDYSYPNGVKEDD